jgi:hypothetical protein
MTIDPMAALTSVTDSAASSALGAESMASPAGAAPATSANAASSAAQAPAAEQAVRVDLFDYAADQQAKPPAIDTLAPESKAKYLANPSALGEKVLQQMEKLHERSMNYHHQFDARAAAPTEGSAVDSSVMGGPASQHVAGTAEVSPSNPYTGLKLMFDYAVETTMISKTSSQFVSSVNTLIKGQ